MCVVPGDTCPSLPVAAIAGLCRRGVVCCCLPPDRHHIAAATMVVVCDDIVCEAACLGVVVVVALCAMRACGVELSLPDLDRGVWSWQCVRGTHVCDH